MATPMFCLLSGQDKGSRVQAYKDRPSKLAFMQDAKCALIRSPLQIVRLPPPQHNGHDPGSHLFIDPRPTFGHHRQASTTTHRVNLCICTASTDRSFPSRTTSKVVVFFSSTVTAIFDPFKSPAATFFRTLVGEGSPNFRLEAVPKIGCNDCCSCLPLCHFAFYQARSHQSDSYICVGVRWRSINL
jgi:hypothetical protein